MMLGGCEVDAGGRGGGEEVGQKKITEGHYASLLLRNHTLSEMYVGVPPVNLVDSGSAFLERRSPKPVESPLPVSSPMAIENLISPRK